MNEKIIICLRELIEIKKNKIFLYIKLLTPKNNYLFPLYYNLDKQIDRCQCHIAPYNL